MEHFFGKVRTKIEFESPRKDEDELFRYPRLDSYLHPTPIGTIAFNFWAEIPQHYPHVILDTFVVMPNHIHGIIIIDKNDLKEWQPNQFGPQKGTLSNIIGSYKAAVKRQANLQNIAFAWQGRYHDRVIRDAGEFDRIQEYIWNNPHRWQEKDKKYF